MKIQGGSDCKWITSLLGIGLFLVVVNAITGCGGGKAATTQLPPPPSGSVISVAVSPKAVDLPAEATQNFTAAVSVSGAISQAVTWSVQEGAACGSVSSGGSYTAPNSPGLVCHVVATSQVDSTKTDAATVAISLMSMYVLPSQISLAAGQTQSFTAVVQGTSNTSVSWSVQEGATGGSITNEGFYSAPQSLGSFHVVATSQADPRFVAVAQVNVVPIAVNIFPKADTLGRGGVRGFTATMTLSDEAVSWAVQEGSAGGSVTSTGVYTAPQALGTFHVVAASLEDPTIEAIASVTVVQAGFVETGPMSTGRQSHAATLLADGRVLITGGEGEITSDCGCGPIFASAEIYDRGSGTFTATGSMAKERTGHTATLLPGGKVLIAGGGPDSTAELFDPASGTFGAVGDMTTPRQRHTATLLPNGKVLIAGGGSASAELFDPASGTFAATGNMNTPRLGHTATLLSNGKVLIAGGTGDSGPLASAELFDPASGSFTATSPMAMARTSHTATLLYTTSQGKVLIAGGCDAVWPLNSAELFDPASETFLPQSNMIAPRAGHSAALLPDGMVLINGGSDSNNFGLPGFTAELFDPASGAFTTAASMATPRMFHTATLLGDGSVLVVGGLIDDAAVTAFAELYK
jgi:hypothetical protein